MKPKTIITPAITEADTLLQTLAKTRRCLAGRESALAQDIAAIRASRAPAMLGLQQAIARMEKELAAHAKKHKSALFNTTSDSDRLDLPCGGALIWAVRRPVKRIKGMLQTLKDLGKKHLIKVAEAPDWDAIEKLPADDLVILGASRTRKEEIAWELPAQAAADSPLEGCPPFNSPLEGGQGGVS